uniref:Beta-ketoacyl synthase-like N-terminal domain-containing protein n=1 Tax=Micromonospora carbonacea TaxID=47853 RepID=A0A7D6GC17_9ACTN|nr:hypothetical protein HZU44_27435 [Micromonospora carbonacea]
MAVRAPGGVADLDAYCRPSCTPGTSPATCRPTGVPLLEVAWEAFEHAAIPVAAVAAATGVFVGITGRDYWQWLSGVPNSYWTIGNGHAFAAGRIARRARPDPGG